ncbi:DUF5753 domain-containing protein [Kitasatospora kifunensis]|uniref:DUF5753 domain-containing protein n=1 Tax=Kitasatospora kifunensis TaxID=58351 RepID=A0A7W7W000_KITKI|nr:DUF5753 domain-containing protein [Kitasatospora kifunensis]MBB4928259.1 hypothetical protein [Kitasatospora kifunensis]
MTMASTSRLGAVQQLYLDLARHAKDYRGYHAEVLWGDVQTEAYMRVLFARHAAVEPVSEAEIEEAVQARLVRADLLLEGTRSYRVVIWEPALHVPLGGTEVMRDQLTHLLDRLDTLGLRLGVLPLGTEPVAGLSAGFSIYNGLRVEVDSLAGRQDISDLGHVAKFTRAFEVLAGAALYGDDARRLITGIRDRM